MTPGFSWRGKRVFGHTGLHYKWMAFASAWCLLACVALCGIAQQPDSKQLSDAHQIFLLRDELRKAPDALPSIYSGEVSCDFNDEMACTEKFKRVLQAAPASITAQRIHHILSYAATRQGHYKSALKEMDAILAANPKDSDAIATRPFVEAFSHFPDQVVQEGSATKAMVRMNGHMLPLNINGKKASYIFDTGANISLMSESEALRLGLQVQNIQAQPNLNDVNGSRIQARVAIAKTLSVGGVVLNNVAFVVVSDDQQPFPVTKIGERGLIGLPVLLAFRSIRWTRDGKFEIDRSPKPLDIAAANLCFDDLRLITNVTYEEQTLPFSLDTGAGVTDLWPKFADVAEDAIRRSGTGESRSSIGIGGETEFESTSLPKVSLIVGDKPVTLKPAHILNNLKSYTARWYFGNVGNDLLQQAGAVSMDFRTMKLLLEAESGNHSSN